MNAARLKAFLSSIAINVYVAVDEWVRRAITNTTFNGVTLLNFGMLRRNITP